jgi:hypothetical protein
VTGGGVTQTISIYQPVVGTVYSLTPETLDFTATGGSEDVVVACNTDWTTASSASWATVSPLIGIGPGTINITATANTGGERTATISLTGGDVTKTVTVTQDGAGTGIDNEEIEASVRYANGILTVNTPTAERIDVYSTVGALLYQVQKPAGEAAYSIRHLPRGVLISRGSSGWTKKIVMSD